MKTNKQQIEFIKYAVAHAAKRTIAFDDKPCKTIKPGNLYLPVERGDVPAYWLLVTGKAEKDIYDVVPIFAWTENTGPMDIILDDTVFGKSMTVSFELECSLGKNSLGRSIGKLPENVMKNIYTAMNSLNGGTVKDRAPGFMWGWEYIDEQDLRYQYHATLLNELIALQQPLRETIFQPETVAESWSFAGELQKIWPKIIPQLEALPAAAASDDDISVPVVNLDLRVVQSKAVAKLKCWALPDSFSPENAQKLCYIVNQDSGEIMAEAELLKHRVVPADKKWLADKNICLVVVHNKAKNKS